MPGEYGAGGVRRRDDGRWMVRIMVDGKRITRYAATEDEAEKIRRQMVRDKQRGKLKAPPRRILVDTLLDRWLTTKEPPEVAPSTLKAYRRRADLHIRPYLGRRNAATLEPLDVQEWLRGRATDGAASSTLAGVRATLSDAFRWAVSVGLLDANPAAGWRTPRGKAPEVRTPPDERASRRFLELARDHRLAALWYLSAYLGLRRGELLGLTWADVDIGRRTLTVARQLKWQDGGWLLDAPKSGAGVRVLPLAGPLPELLGRRRREQIGECLRAGAGRPTLDLVFTTRAGVPYDTKAFWLAMSALARRADAAGIGAHRFRHNVATWLLEADAPDRIIRAFLGHGARGATARYQHVGVETLRPWAARIAARWDTICGVRLVSDRGDG